jgi:dTDP-4-dehydrorhamnose reductase
MNMQDNKVLVLGATGMLGNAVYRYLSQQEDLSVYGTCRSLRDSKYFPFSIQNHLLPSVDVLNQDDLIRVFKQVKPSIVINCVGLIKQLSNAEDPLIALPINAMLPHRLVELTDLMNARLIHISTDCVFAGTKGLYTETDVSDATDLYGVSKKIGEVVHSPHVVTLRTSIIGRALNSKFSLIDWFLSQTQEVKGFTRAIFSGLPTVELAKVIHEYVLPNTSLHGLYHVSSEPIDKYTLISLVADVFNKEISIIPDETLQINRSLDSSLFKKISGYSPPSWRDLIINMKNFG